MGTIVRHGTPLEGTEVVPRIEYPTLVSVTGQTLSVAATLEG